jgi:hypothetical protein
MQFEASLAKKLENPISINKPGLYPEPVIPAKQRLAPGKIVKNN